MHAGIRWTRHIPSYRNLGKINYGSSIGRAESDIWGPHLKFFMKTRIPILRFSGPDRGAGEARTFPFRAPAFTSRRQHEYYSHVCIILLRELPAWLRRGP